MAALIRMIYSCDQLKVEVVEDAFERLKVIRKKTNDEPCAKNYLQLLDMLALFRELVRGRLTEAMSCLPSQSEKSEKTEAEAEAAAAATAAARKIADTRSRFQKEMNQEVSRVLARYKNDYGRHGCWSWDQDFPEDLENMRTRVDNHDLIHELHQSGQGQHQSGQRQHQSGQGPHQSGQGQHQSGQRQQQS